MDIRQFVALVRMMREKQNAYYRLGRKQSDLIASKELEKAVDAALLDGVSLTVQDAVEMQSNLFKEDGNEA